MIPSATPAISPLVSLIGLDPEALASALVALGEKPFRGKQIAQWLYQRRIADFDHMTDLSMDLREKLKQHSALRTANVIARDHSPESNTTKLALRYPDGVIVECVLMIEEPSETRKFEEGEAAHLRYTACISTQAGCAMGCRFCASGQLGLKRHLTPPEILEQFYAIAGILPENQWLTNVVYMGMGEPLHNWDGFTGSLKVLTAEWGFGMSPRRITVSTVGVAQRITELAALDIPVHLAISLHAPNDQVRTRLIPTNRAYGGIEGILSAARTYYHITGRQVTFEYTLVRDINDSLEQARELTMLLKDRFDGCNINLIPMNPVEDSGLKTPDEENVRMFAHILKSAGFSVHTRKKKGRSVNAACGQLRLRLEKATTV